MAEGKIDMSNPRLWRTKPRTSKPNSRQKRNGLFLDAHPDCQRCSRQAAEEAHHDLPKGHPQRYLWRYMRALFRICHVAVHRRSAPARPRRRKR